MRLVSLSLLLVAASSAVAQQPGAAVGVDSSGTLKATVVGRQDGQPVPYGSVQLVETAETRFTDAGGQFRKSHLIPGRYTLRVRQIGYAPTDTTVQVDAAPAVTTVTIRMVRIPPLLKMVKVEGQRGGNCVATGIPDSTVNPGLAAILAQVQGNVDRFRLLVDGYPFRYAREQERLIRSTRGDSTVGVDTVEFSSKVRQRYREGRVVYWGTDPHGRRTQFMYLPTFRDLGDSAFLSTHCFTYQGTEPLYGKSGPSVLRIDFQPASRIREPDVAGAIYLDEKQYIVRRAVLRLTRHESVWPPILGFTVTTTFRELVPLVPVFDSIEADQPLQATAGLGSRQAVENDRLLSYAFENRVPGAQATEAPTSASGGVNAVAATPGARPPGVELSTSPALATPLTGRVVRSDGTPVAGATVGLVGLADTAITGDSGEFTLSSGAARAHQLWVSPLGFEEGRVPDKV